MKTRLSSIALSMLLSSWFLTGCGTEKQDALSNGDNKKPDSTIGSDNSSNGDNSDGTNGDNSNGSTGDNSNGSTGDNSNGSTGDNSNGSTGDVSTTSPYTRKSLISDVMSDPVFGDYGRLLFPVQRSYWSGTTLESLRLTYYNYIDPDETVAIVNYLHNQAKDKQTIFFDIYTDAEKAADPRKRDTGLFFFRANGSNASNASRQANNASSKASNISRQASNASSKASNISSQAVPAKARFAVCNAGGAFAFVGAMHDSFPHALELSKMGYNAFALIYRPGAQTACEDLARAISFIFSHADELGVNTDCYSLWGGSAGGRMAAWVSGYGTAAFGGDNLPKAGAAIIQYTGLSDYSKDDVATYACVGSSDGIAYWRTMQARLAGLSSLGIPTEFHVYDGLPHGFGLGKGTVAEGWINDAVKFWEKQMK